MTKARDIAEGNVVGGDSLGTVTNNDVDLSTGNFFEITTSDQVLTFSNSPTVHYFKFKLNGANTVSNFDIVNGSWDGAGFNLDISGQEPSVMGITFNNDGTKLYMVGENSDTIYQYSVTTPFDLSTAYYDSVSLYIRSQDSLPRGITFNNDGTKLYMIGFNDIVYQYTLATAFVLNSASWDGSGYNFSVASQLSQPQALIFNNDGSKMYVMGNITDKIFQYSLSTNYEVSSASYDSVILDVSSEDNNSLALAFNTDGTKLFTMGNQHDTVYRYGLTTAFDLSTASYDSVSLDVSGRDGTAISLAFSNDGKKMFVAGYNNDTIFQYSTSSITLATITYPSSVKFPDATPPATPDDGEVDTLEIYTLDGGVSYFVNSFSNNQS
jgi:hypothetical protein